LSKTLYLNPEYVWSREEYQLIKDMYEGRHDVMCRNPAYLWLHAIEESKTGELPNAKGSKHLARRRNRTRYLNLPEIITSLLISFFFKGEGKASAGLLSFLGKQYDDIDGENTSLPSFIKTKIAEPYLIYGKSVVFADSIKHTALTQAQAQEQGARAFLTAINPLSFVDWQRVGRGDSAGKLKFGRYVYDEIQEREDETQEPEIYRMSRSYSMLNNQVIRRIYRAEKKEGSMRPEITGGELIDSTQWIEQEAELTQLQQVPIAILQDVSWIKDVCQETLRYHNLRSSKDNILHNQGYQKTFIIPGASGEVDDIGYNNETSWIILPPGSSVVTVDPVDTAAHERAEADSISNAFKLGLNQLRMLSGDSKLVQAADSLLEEKSNTIALIQSTLEDIENHTNEALINYASYSRNAPKDLTYEINKDINTNDLDSFIKVYSMFRDLIGQYPDIQKEALKKAVYKMDLSKEGLKIALKSLEAGSKVEPPETQNAAVAEALGG